MPAISVIIPVYNAEEYIGSTLQNILHQTFADFEVIVVDDGSSDTTSEIVNRICLHDGRVMLVQQSNCGAAAARNKGIMLASGSFVLFLDADDSYSLFYLEKMYSAIINSSADIVVCEANAVDVRKNSTRSLVRFPRYLNGDKTREEVGSSLFEVCYTAPWNKLIKKSLILEHRLKFQNIAAHNDIYFVCSVLAYSNRIYFIPEPLVQYTVGEGTSIQDKRVDHPFCEFDALERLSHERCFSKKTGSRVLQVALARLVVNGFYNSAPAVIAGGRRLRRLIDRYKRLMSSLEECSSELPIIIKMKKHIIDSSSEQALEKAFSAFKDQRNHAFINKVIFMLKILSTILS